MRKIVQLLQLFIITLLLLSCENQLDIDPILQQDNPNNLIQPPNNSNYMFDIDGIGEAVTKTDIRKHTYKS